MNAASLLIHDEFVAYFPALGRALGSVEDAVLVQAVWFRRDRSTGETKATAAELADLVGMKLRTAERRLARLTTSGVLAKRRAGSYDATSVWAVHPDKIRVIPDPATMADSNRPNRRDHSATLAESETATLAGSTYLEEQEELNTRTSEPAIAATDDAGASEETRPEVEALCSLLADLIESNGSKRPTIGKRWRDAARLMLDRDGRTPAEVEGAIRWAQGNEFWRANVLSMPKLREKFDTMRLQAQRDGGGRDRQAEILRREMEAARAFDAGQDQGQLAIGGGAR